MDTLLFRKMHIFSQLGVSEAFTQRFFGFFFFPKCDCLYFFLEQICIAAHPTLPESGFAGVGHFVRQLKKKERIFRSKLERRGPSLPLNLVERLSALFKSEILAELQLLSILNLQNWKQKQVKAHQKSRETKQPLINVWLLWIQEYEHDRKITAFWTGAMSATSTLSAFFLRQWPFWEGYSWPLEIVLALMHSNDDSIPLNPLFLKQKKNSSIFTGLYIYCFPSNINKPILGIKKKVIFPNSK